MCNPAQSNRIAHEYSVLNNENLFPINENFNKQTTSNELKLKLPPLENLRILRISGGEPLVDVECKKFCLFLIEQGLSKKIHLIVISNMTRLDEEWLKIFSEFEQNSLQISLDGIGPVIEYIRDGTNWKIMKANIERAVGSLQNTRFVIVLCVNSYSLPNLDEVYAYIEKLKACFPQKI